MKYTLNHQPINIALNQAVIAEHQRPTAHHDWVAPQQKWYKRGYTAMPLPASFFKKTRQHTQAYIQQCVQQALQFELPRLTAYHRCAVTQEQHLKVLQQIGKLLAPADLGIDVPLLEKQVKKLCGVNIDLTCNNWCDIRIFRPYTGHAMDNNPLHRDTWLPAINNCINVYIPIEGNNAKSSLSLIPGSHLWPNNLVERTTENALINGIQYGLPSVAKINAPYKVIRPVLKANEALLFSSHLIHGGAVNLNRNTTRVSIEIRFWKK